MKRSVLPLFVATQTALSRNTSQDTVFAVLCHLRSPSNLRVWNKDSVVTSSWRPFLWSIFCVWNSYYFIGNSDDKTPPRALYRQNLGLGLGLGLGYSHNGTVLVQGVKLKAPLMLRVWLTDVTRASFQLHGRRTTLTYCFVFVYVSRDRTRVIILSYFILINYITSAFLAGAVKDCTLLSRASSAAL